jgi:hypothetical protein
MLQTQCKWSAIFYFRSIRITGRVQTKFSGPDALRMECKFLFPIHSQCVWSANKNFRFIRIANAAQILTDGPFCLEKLQVLTCNRLNPKFLRNFWVFNMLRSSPRASSRLAERWTYPFAENASSLSALGRGQGEEKKRNSMIKTPAMTNRSPHLVPLPVPRGEEEHCAR